jgi:hypothetical protein
MIDWLLHALFLSVSVNIETRCINNSVMVRAVKGGTEMDAALTEATDAGRHLYFRRAALWYLGWRISAEKA